MRADFSFTLTPIHAIEYLRQKGFKQTFFYDEMMHDAHHAAFTVAKIMRNDLLSDIKDSLTKALQEGIGFEEWQKTITPTLKRYGWYGKIDAVNPKTGEIKTINVNSRRLSTIYHTNIRVAHAQARYQRLMALPFSTNWMYLSALLPNTRASHRARHGTTLPRDDSWWETNYPPNGWGCKCKVIALSPKEMEKQGITLTSPRPENIASSDWAYHVGKTQSSQNLYTQNIAQLTDPKIKEKAAAELKKFDKIAALHVAKQQLHEMVDEVIIKQNIKYPLNYIAIGTLSDFIIQALRELLGIQAENTGLLLEKNRLLHARPERKEEYDQALRAEEIKAIADIIDHPQEVYIDTAKEHQNIFYTFDDQKDQTKVNKIIVDINTKVKKFGKTNAIITLSKTKKENLQADIKGGIVKKIERP